ncbi:MAG TPA: ABC transporter permease subunit [Gemmatimonadales bacterium]|jgi:Cu-processing system permease protein|nr:ABC transporter permease subunit [Gemmatimonadales bacterium]
MTAARVLRYELQDLRRSRWVFGYGLLLLVLTDSLLRFGGGGPRALVSLLNLVLVLVPLVSIVFGTMYLYGARDFIELLLAQPVRRRSLCAGLYAGLALPLGVAFVIGVGLPFLWGGQGDGSLARPLLTLLGAGVLLTLVFTALAFLVSLLFDDRARGLGVALLLWFAATALYDALLVFVAVAWSAYPLETPLLGLTLLNPVDLGRVLLMLQFDSAALMGYTGAVFERFFGSALGAAAAALALLAWCAIPLALAARRFERKDF